MENKDTDQIAWEAICLLRLLCEVRGTFQTIYSSNRL